MYFPSFRGEDGCIIADLLTVARRNKYHKARGLTLRDLRKKVVELGADDLVHPARLVVRERGAGKRQHVCGVHAARALGAHFIKTGQLL